MGSVLQVASVGGVGGSPNNPVQVSAGAQSPMSSTLPPTCVSER